MVQEAGSLWIGRMRWWLFGCFAFLTLSLILAAGGLLASGVTGEVGWLVLIPFTILVALAFWPLHLAKLLWNGDLYRFLRASVTSVAVLLWVSAVLLFDWVLPAIEVNRDRPLLSLGRVVVVYIVPIALAAFAEPFLQRQVYRRFLRVQEIDRSSPR